MSVRKRAFTLLELLAAVTILVILGTMLFEVFGKASDVVRTSNARQDVFQYARASLEFLEREIGGAFVSSDANIVTGGGTGTGIKGFRVYNTPNSMGANCVMREGSQGIFFSTGIMARDTSGTPATNPSYGHDVNVARVAYYLNNETNQLWKAALCRSEMYDLTVGVPLAGGPFVRNCLSFNMEVMSGLGGFLGNSFRPQDWNSDVDATGNPAGRPRRGLPRAVKITLRITDEQDAHQYVWGSDPASSSAPKKWYISGPDPTKDYWVDEDPVVQTFSQVIYFGRRQFLL